MQSTISDTTTGGQTHPSQFLPGRSNVDQIWGQISDSDVFCTRVVGFRKAGVLVLEPGGATSRFFHPVCQHRRSQSWTLPSENVLAARARSVTTTRLGMTVFILDAGMSVERTMWVRVLHARKIPCMARGKERSTPRSVACDREIPT